MLLFRAPAGSRLYGTYRPDSDYDFFEIHDKLGGRRKSHTSQTIVNGIDTIKTDVSSWMNACSNGSHQHLDAAFTAPALAEVDLITDFRRSYRANVPVAVSAFQRVIRSFTDGTLKQRRHAVRLQWCIEEMLKFGRYNPILSPEKVCLLVEIK